MSWALTDSDAVGFTDVNAGHTYTIPTGAPGASDLDILCVNSNTVINTPSGFTKRVDATNNQGAYIFTRLGGSGTTISISGSGDNNTTLIWSRWTGSNAYSTGNFTRADNSNNTVLPATTTGTLAETGMLVIAYAALHNFDGTLATSPSWSNSFTAMESASQGAAGSSAAVVGFAGYKTNAGTASETIDSVSWTNNARNRYALWIAVTASADAFVRPTIVAPTGAVQRAGTW
jgi:hypothetical protein